MTRAPGEAEALIRSTLDALTAHIAVLDESGTILAVNAAWRSFARNNGFIGEDHGVGMSYLSVCDACARGSAEAARCAAALRDLIAGRRSEFRIEYPCDTPEGRRWFQLRMTRPAALQPLRIVVAHEDITEVKRAQAALARLSSRLIQLQDEERRSIARELHDTTAQNLLAITFNVARLREPLADAGEPARRVLEETMELAEQSLQEVRTLSYLLHPPLLDEMGLVSALRWLAKGFAERSGIEVGVEIVEDSRVRLPREIATALFRVAQEALSNVHRHSGSPSARIALHKAEKSVSLEVTDRGRGFRSEIEAGVSAGVVGVGISGMRIRLEQLGGSLDVQSSPSGTTVRATIPIPPGAAGAARPPAPQGPYPAIAVEPHR